MTARLACLAILFAAAHAAAADPETAPAATIVSTTGLVRVQEREGGAVAAAKKGMNLPEGAKVMTMKGAFAEIAFSPAHFVKLGPVSTILISRHRKPERGSLRILIRVVLGRVRAAVDRSKAEGSDFGLYGASVISAVKGTEYEFNRESESEAEVTVDEGKVDVAETKDESVEEAEKAFVLLLAGSIGMKLLEGYQMNCRRGKGLPTARPIPADYKSPLRGRGKTSLDGTSPAGRERGARERGTSGRQGTDRVSGREKAGKTTRPERGGKGGKTSAPGPSTPSVPGLPGIGFP